MIKKILDIFHNLDTMTSKLIKIGLKFSFIISILGTLILLTYNITQYSPNLYYIGLLIFKLSCIFCVEFIVCGLIVDSIKKAVL